MKFKYLPPMHRNIFACAVLAICTAACNPPHGNKAAVFVPAETGGRAKTGLRVYKPGKCYTGYTLFTHNPVGNILFSPIYLIDMRGEVKQQWVPEVPAIHARLMPDGSLFYNTTSATHLHSAALYGLYELDAHSNVTWQLPGDISHDFQVMDDGNFLVSEQDADDPELKIVTRANKVLWSWKGADHLDELEALTGVRISTGPDWAHNNAAVFLGPNKLEKKDQRFKKGNILFSFCEQDTIGIIDYPTGRIVWAWGKGVLRQQHAPEMLENGNIIVFDNGRSGSRVLEIDPRSGRIVWKYQGQTPGSFYSARLSNATRLPNGNTLICEGNPGRIFEITPEGETVWEFISPYTQLTGNSGIYRAYRYSGKYVKPLFKAAKKLNENKTAR